jgi:hypothetical protein
MRQPFTGILALLLLCSIQKTAAQSRTIIPAFTAYALPEEEGTDTDESMLFSPKEGLHNWYNTGETIHFFFKLRHTGELTLFLQMKSPAAGNRIEATIRGKKFSVAVPRSAAFQLVPLGKLNITDTGFYELTLKGITRSKAVIADISSLQIGGTASLHAHFNPKPRRNAASVHLLYPVADSNKTVGFYNEITVPAGADPLYTYYMACGFARGYFGIQVNSPTERRVIFSVWDAGNEAVDRNKVSEDNKVKLVAKGENVIADDFGNEGTGGHSHWVYPWQAGTTYRFYVAAVSDSATQTTDYTGYFFIPEQQRWKLIASFKAPKDGKLLRNLYSFSENFYGNNGQLKRKAFFGNTWTRRETGEWLETTEARFSYDATGRAGDRIDYGGGADSTRFYLWNGGFADASAGPGQVFTRKSSGPRPQIDLYRNADSLATAQKEAADIQGYIKSEPASWKNDQGVYYKILSEGTGPEVKVSDTLVVHYRGSLLNGFVFDETKDKPATFPLKRLIRGWQTGLVHARRGGKIRLLIPSALAYTIRNLGEIPPNSTLIFDVEIVDSKPGS